MSSEQLELELVIEPKSESSGGKFYKALYGLLGPDGKDGELRLSVDDGSVIFERTGSKVGLQILDAERRLVISTAPRDYDAEQVRWDESMAKRGLPVALVLDRERFGGEFEIERVDEPTFGDIVATLRDARMKFVRVDVTEGTLILDQGRTGVALVVKRDDVGGDVRVNWGLTWNGKALFWVD